MRRLWRMASGMSRNSAAIAAGGFRWRSTLASSRRPAWSRVVPRRMQVRTSRSERPSGAAGEAVEAGGVLLDLRPRDQRLALRAPERARGEEAAEVLVAGALLDQEPEAAGARDRHLRADQGAETRAARGLEEARRAVDAARVGERQRVVAEHGGAFDQILRQRGAGEEAERAPAAQLDVVSHRRRPRTTARSPESSGRSRRPS